MTVLDFMADPALCGSVFAPIHTWSAWRVFLAAVYGLDLDAEGQAIFCKHTGRSHYAPPPGGWSEVACIVGRQSGKSRVAALIAAYEAARAQRPADGTTIYALLIAQDLRGARRTLFGYATSLLRASPMLEAAVQDELRESMELKGGSVLACYPCTPPAVRGLRASVAVCDEIAHYRGSDWRPLDREIIRALRPTMATTGGKLVLISSPYAQTGVLHDVHRKHYGRDDAPMLIWTASAPEMNATLSRDYLDRMRDEDPEGYRAEVLGEFLAGLSSLFDPEAVRAAVITGRRELAPIPNARPKYAAFADPSGGRGDAFTLTIGHRDGECAVIDVLRAWEPPFNPAGVAAEVADLLRTYDLSSVTGDKYAAGFCAEAFAAVGIKYTDAPLDRSGLYLALLGFVNSGRVELPDDEPLVRELCTLERRRGPSGRDRVDHPPGRHDDRANSVAGLCFELIGQPKKHHQIFV